MSKNSCSVICCQGEGLLDEETPSVEVVEIHAHCLLKCLNDLNMNIPTNTSPTLS